MAQFPLHWGWLNEVLESFNVLRLTANGAIDEGSMNSGSSIFWRRIQVRSKRGVAKVMRARLNGTWNRVKQTETMIERAATIKITIQDCRKIRVAHNVPNEWY